MEASSEVRSLQIPARGRRRGIHLRAAGERVSVEEGSSSCGGRGYGAHGGGVAACGERLQQLLGRACASLKFDFSGPLECRIFFSYFLSFLMKK